MNAVLERVSQKVNRKLSPREEEIVDLCVGGLTNDGIAHRLGISIGTVNTYWLRIKMKVGGLGKTDTVVKVIKEKAELALRQENTERQHLTEIVAEKQKTSIEIRSASALLQLAMDQIKSTVWATDSDLVIYVLANGAYPSTHFGVVWEVGKTIYDIFKTTNSSHGAVAAHLAALRGEESAFRLTGEFANVFLRVKPLRADSGKIIGCISILNIVD